MFKWLFCNHDSCYLEPIKTHYCLDTLGRMTYHASYYKCTCCKRTIKKVTKQ